MPRLKFIPPPSPPSSYSANVHSTGRLGFTISTAKDFGITVGKSMQLAIDEDDTTHNIIYGILLNTVDEKNAYKIMKAGDYHSVNAKGFFDTIGIKYTAGKLSYTVSEDSINGAKVIKFTLKQQKAS